MSKKSDKEWAAGHEDPLSILGFERGMKEVRRRKMEGKSLLEKIRIWWKG